MILFIGCGKMGRIILNGLLAVGGDYGEIFVYDPNLTTSIEKVNALKKIPSGTRFAYVFLCVKPHLILTVIGDFQKAGNTAGCFVSIAAGVTLSDLQSSFPESKFIRVMPNILLQVKEGVTGVCYDADFVDDMDVDFVTKLFAQMGLVKVIPERLMDVLTATCSSGPAFILLLIEGLADGACLQGMPKRDAIECVAKTMLGTAKLLLESDCDGDCGGGSNAESIAKEPKHPAQLRDDVCTPGGCTIAGIASLERNRVRGSLIDCIEASVKACKKE